MTARGVFRLILIVLALALGAYKSGFFSSPPSSPAAERETSVVPVPPEALDTTRKPAPPADAGASSLPLRDLAQDEARGGHTIERHVGKSDAELRARVSRERRISAASTYADLETAQQVVADALAQSAARVSRWAAREGGRPNLALDYDGDPDRVIGRSLARADKAPVPCVDAVVVLRWDAAARDWYVLTSYPEVRRDTR